MTQKRGFTLVEIMVVMVVIGVIVAISASSFLAARVNANEGAAKGSLKTLQTACIQYRSTQGAYPVDLNALGTSYLGNGLETGDKSGYLFSLQNGNGGESYTCTAVPKSANFTGVKSFCTDAYNVIYSYNASSLSGDGIACPPGGTALT